MAHCKRLRLMQVVGVLLVAVVVSACTGSPAGEVKPRSSVSQDTSAAVLGDLRTVDPCALMDPASLREFGDATVADTVSMDYCLLHLRTNNGGLVQLAAGELDTVDAQDAAGQPVVQHGTLRIIQDAPLQGHCSRQIMFTDQIAMRVSADSLTGAPGPGLCAIADAGADHAAGVIEQHRVEHRRFAANSLAMVDPCSILATAIVQEIPGLEHAAAQAGPARHQCRWGEQETGATRVQLVHTAGAPPRVLHGTAVEQQIAGRRTVVSIVGGDPRTPLCMAETGHIPFGDPHAGQVEVAMLVVAVPGTNGIHACEIARGLAERTWPRLPAS